MRVYGHRVHRGVKYKSIPEKERFFGMQVLKLHLCEIWRTPKRETPELPSVTDTATLSLKGPYPGREALEEPCLYLSLIHQWPLMTTKRIKETQRRDKWPSFLTLLAMVFRVSGHGLRSSKVYMVGERPEAKFTSMRVSKPRHFLKMICSR